MQPLIPNGPGMDTAPTSPADMATLPSTPGTMDTTPPAPAGMLDQNNMSGASPDTLTNNPPSPGHTFGAETPTAFALQDTVGQPNATNNELTTQTGTEANTMDRRQPAKDHYSTLPTAELLQDRSVIDEVLKERGENTPASPTETSTTPM